MEKKKFIPVKKFIRTQDVERVYGEIEWDKDSKSYKDGWGLLINDDVYAESLAKTIYTDESKTTIVGVNLIVDFKEVK